jgi:hypothetical protein
MNGYYITQDYPTVKVPLEPKEIIDLSYMGLIELVLPKCKKVWCHRNYLTELIIPIGCEHISCYYNYLTELIIPQSCEHVYCWNNSLTKLITHRGCKYVECSNNNLHPIIGNLLQSNDPIKIELASNLQIDYNYKSICDHSLIF